MQSGWVTEGEPLSFADPGAPDGPTGMAPHSGESGAVETDGALEPEREWALPGDGSAGESWQTMGGRIQPDESMLLTKAGARMSWRPIGSSHGQSRP